MSIANKYANEGHEDITVATTRSVSRHGLSKGQRREKKVRNRAAKRFEARMALAEVGETHAGSW